MPNPPPLSALTRRESQIMEILFRRGQATAAEVLAELPDAPSYSTARKLLEILEEKGYVQHAQEGPRYVYTPVVAADDARNSALEQMVRTFFHGSIGSAVTALLELQGPQLSDEELDRIAKLAEQAKKEGR
ncbi:Penicillinase repressor [Gemmatirosa kalamazoonensis]|uniref:Penicillinase repressor n=1 Tax=Gemmatirosa kalamazoonensis TaxID=861299 RepID=W0RAH5_9BACT|nr:BlaI/MecI/CopY family transcriptional regulator [Gemmatirosa kalamazoonensis]AHG87781.1 Penicillinase repressor [Gemmatirosa kalamazoonensis]